MNKSMLCSGFLALFAAQFAGAAATCTWTGGGANSNWSNSANWNNCANAHALPVDGDTLVFPDGVPRLTNNNDLVKLMAGQVLIDGSVDISGNSIGLSDGIVASVPLAATAPVVHLGIVLETSTQIFQCSSGHRPLSLGGTINLNGHPLTLDSSCNIFLAGNIIGAGGITKIGASTLFLEGASSSYTGVTTINTGRVRLVSSAALGASGTGNETVINDGAALELADTATAEDLNLSGTGIGNQGALVGVAGNNDVDGDIVLAADTTISAATAGTVLTLNGSMSGASFIVTKIGAGTLRLEGTTADFGTLASAGTLEVNGPATKVGASNTGLLAGSGSFSNDLLLGPEGTIAPGTNAGGRIGTLSGTNFGWNGGGTLAFQLGATSALSDHLVFSGDVGIGGIAADYAFEFSDAATPPLPGVTYTLINFGGQLLFACSCTFSFTYTGTGPGSSMAGTFAFTPTEVQFTPSAVVSDLIFRDGAG